MQLDGVGFAVRVCRGRRKTQGSRKPGRLRDPKQDDLGDTFVSAQSSVRALDVGTFARTVREGKCGTMFAGEMRPNDAGFIRFESRKYQTAHRQVLS